MTHRDEKRHSELIEIVQERLDSEADCREEAGLALAELKPFFPVYSSEGWDAFCKEKFQFWDGNKRKPLSGRHADRLIAFAKMRAKLGPQGPKNEYESRALAQFPEHLRASAMKALAAGGEITASRIAELLAEVTASKDPAKVIARWRVEASRRRAADEANQRRQDSEATREEKAVAAFKKKLSKIRVQTVTEVRRAHVSSRKLIGILDMDQIDPLLAGMVEKADEIAHLAALAIDAAAASEATGSAEESKAA